jgi:hypothetical protein
MLMKLYTITKCVIRSELNIKTNEEEFSKQTSERACCMNVFILVTFIFVTKFMHQSPQLVDKFPAFYRTPRFTSGFKITHYWNIL